jgi:hypothetical protein
MAHPSSPAAGIALVTCLVVLAAAGVVGDVRPAAGQGEACARGEPAALLVAAPGRPTPAFVRTGQHEALETFRVDSKTELAIRHFGCAHFALEFTFTTRSTPPPRATAWPARAARWLRSLPVVPSQRRVVEHLARQLEQAGARAYAPGTRLQVSETATLTLDVHRGPSDTRLVILYDIAL